MTTTVISVWGSTPTALIWLRLRTLLRADAYVTDGVVDIRGHFADDRQAVIVRGLAGQVPGVLRVHTRPPHWV